jgi:hypothetical protein
MPAECLLDDCSDSSRDAAARGERGGRETHRISSTLSDTPLAWPMVLPSKPRWQRFGSVCAVPTHQSEAVLSPVRPQTLERARALSVATASAFWTAHMPLISQRAPRVVCACVCGGAPHALLRGIALSLSPLSRGGSLIDSAKAGVPMVRLTAASAAANLAGTPSRFSALRRVAASPSAHNIVEPVSPTI